MFKVSQSKVKLWRRCRQAYHYRYKEGLQKRRVARPLTFGRIVHEMLESYADGGNPFDVLTAIHLENKKLFDAEREEYGDIINDIYYIMREYFTHYSGDSLVYVRKNKKSSEHPFEIELMDGILWTGKIDAIAKTPNKFRWLVEHKTFNRMMSEDDRWRNLQSVTYIRAIDMLGWRSVDGVCWDNISSKSPGVPEILKSGAVSQRRLASLPSRIEAWLKEQGLDPKDHNELLERAAASRGDWFVRIFTPRKKNVVDIIFEEFKGTVREMVELDGRPPQRSIENHCSWCEFEPICRAALTGGDVDFVKEREYYVEKSADEV